MHAAIDTRRVQAVEARFKRPLVDVLVDLYNDRGFEGMTKELGVGRSTAWYWLLRCGIRIERVALRPGERVVIAGPDPK